MPLLKRLRKISLVISMLTLGAGCGHSSTTLSATTDGATPLTPPSSLSYPAGPLIYLKGMLIDPVKPLVKGSGLRFSVTPALPEGLILSATNGTISGRPADVTATTTYTVTAQNSGGSLSAAIIITVNLCDRLLSYPGAGHRVDLLPSDVSPMDLNTFCISGITAPTDLFIVYTNPDATMSGTIPGGFESGVISAPRRAPRLRSTGSSAHYPSTPEYVRHFDEDRPPLIRGTHTGGPGRQLAPKKSPSYTVGTTTRPWMTSGALSMGYDPVETTLRGSAALPGGKSAYIWVADNVWTVTATHKRIDQTKVDAALSYFANRTPSIYTLVSTIAGDEWGPHGVVNAIAGTGATNDEIHIVLYDINGALLGNTNSSTLGFFWSANNYTDLPYSNQALVFFMDAIYFGTIDAGQSSWSASSRTPQLSLGTLAHEFQHMIQFYQKTVLRGTEPETWLNEMASVTIEDMIAYYIGGVGSGPAQSPNGLLAEYIANSLCTVTLWSIDPYGQCGLMDSYSHALAFGTYLVRSYGGAEMLRAIIQSSGAGMDAIDDALVATGHPDTDSQLALTRWGVSLALDPNTGTMPEYFGYPALTEKDFFGTGLDLTMNEADIYGFTTFRPLIFETPPATILPLSSVVHQYKKGVTKEIVFPFSIPMNVKTTIVLSPAK